MYVFGKCMGINLNDLVKRAIFFFNSKFTKIPAQKMQCSILVKEIESVVSKKKKQIKLIRHREFYRQVLHI